MNTVRAWVLMAALALIIAAPKASFAAPEEQYWTSVQITSKLDEKWSVIGEWINRYASTQGEFVTRSVRLGLGYKFAEKWTYAIITESRETNSTTNDEQRFIHQFSRKWEFEPATLHFRGRLEQREFSDSPIFMNRLRALVRVDATQFKFWKLTPFVTGETFYILNSVTSRPEASTEQRGHIGVFFDILGGQMDVAYLNRTQYAPQHEGKAHKFSQYNIANASMKWTF